MRLWTIQPVSVYEKLLNQKVLYVDKNLADNITGKYSFKESYDWLIIKMKERIGVDESAEYPWWAWYKRDYKHMKPDLRESAYEIKGTKCVCLELEIPDNEVVLSDFDTWHLVLNNCWYNPAHNEKEYDKLEDWYDNLSQEEQQKLKVDSWDNIFNITPLSNGWERNGAYVQATFWVLKLDYVKKIQYFIAR